MSLPTKIGKLNHELIEYFTKRGWKSRILFTDTNDNNILLATSYFSVSTNSHKSCNWHETYNKELIKKYTYWFFEHVKPFWLKSKIGNHYFEGEHGDNTAKYTIFINENGDVEYIAFSPAFK